MTRSTLACGGVALGLLLAGPAQAAAPKQPTCLPDKAPIATVIVIHGGGFVWPGWGDMSLCRALARRGYRAVNLVYPLHNLPGAVRTTRRVARAERRRRRGRHVYAFGLSVGGTLAELAALSNEVDGAIAVAAPTDLLHWAPGGPIAGETWSSARAYWEDVGATRAERRAASPIYRAKGSAAPLLLFHSRADEVVPPSQSRRLARRAHGARLRYLRGRHLKSQKYRTPAFKWLYRRLHLVS